MTNKNESTVTEPIYDISYEAAKRVLEEDRISTEKRNKKNCTKDAAILVLLLISVLMTVMYSVMANKMNACFAAGVF